MTMIKIEAYLDSGANIHSCRKVTFEVDEAEWLDMDEGQQEEYAKEYAWDRMEWGYNVVNTDDNL